VSQSVSSQAENARAVIPAMAALSPEDRTFATKVPAGGQAEGALGQLAKENASSLAVKQ
jgi:hypothetical protein